VINYKDEKGSAMVWKLYEDRDGNLWVPSRSALKKYSPPIVINVQMSSYLSYGTEDGLGNWLLQSFSENSDGNLWFGSGAGLFLYNRKRENHPCSRKTCNHDLQNPWDLKEHRAEQSKLITNVTKRGPWN
jgi:ligand-binding sensor domain-containing protein